jgi:hypothetical protein
LKKETEQGGKRRGWEGNGRKGGEMGGWKVGGVGKEMGGFKVRRRGGGANRSFEKEGKIGNTD